MQRRPVALGLAALAAAPGVRASKSRRLGVLLFDTQPSWAFLQRDLPPALAQLGWREGSNLTIDWRFADGDAKRLPLLAEALLGDGAQVLLTRGTPATRALQQATRRVPIVTGVGDPVGAGFAASLAAPGSNITGLSYAVVETVAKQLELLREIAPRTRLLLHVMPANRAPFVAELSAAVDLQAARLNWPVQRVLVSRVDELRAALKRAREGQPPLTVSACMASFGQAMDPKDVALAPLHAGVPAVFEHRAYVESGGLLSWRLDWTDQTQRTAVQLAKVLRGDDPAGIPFERPTKSEMALNANSAKMLGLAIPPALRARADEVIG